MIARAIETRKRVVKEFSEEIICEHLHVTSVPTQTLKPSKYNTRTHSKKQIEQIVASIQKFEWTFPILIDEQGIILGGEGRWLAAKQLKGTSKNSVFDDHMRI
jgi:hypothetical protein